MRKTLLFLTLTVSLLLQPLAVAAQTQTGRVNINFGTPASGEVPYQLPFMGDNVFAIRIAKSLSPAVESSVPISRRSDDGALIFFFGIEPGTEVNIARTATGLEIRFAPSQGGASPMVNPGAMTTTSPVSPVSPISPVSPVSPVSPPAAGMTSGGATTSGTTMPASPVSPVTPGATGGTAGAVAAAGSLLAGFIPPPTLLPDQTIKRANVDLAVPESPAFTVLGLTPQTVVRPASPREFATSLLNGFDKDGNFQSGIALDTVPFLLFAGNNLTINEYRRPGNYLTRLLARTQLSFAAVKGATDDDPSVRMSLGLQATLYDKGDPRLDRELDNCFAAAILPTFLAFPPINPTSPQAVRDAEVGRRTQILQGLAEPCREASRKRNWNRSSWIVAAAPSWISTTGASKDFRWNGGGFWTSFAYGFEGVHALQDTSQLILHARYRNKESVADPENEGSFFEQNSAAFGARMRIGNPDFNGNFEGVYNSNRPRGQNRDNSYSLSFAAERKLSDNLFLVFSLGKEGGHRNEDQNKAAVIRSSFQWGFSRKSSF